jgi:hypothetical protein
VSVDISPLKALRVGGPWVLVVVMGFAYFQKDEYLALVKESITILQTSGPWGLVAIVGLAYWQKDRYVQALHARILEHSVAHGQAMTAMTETIRELKSTIEG